MVFADGMGLFSADGYRWTDYPEYLTAHRASLSWLEAVDVDICLTEHPSQMRLLERIKSGTLIDAGECRRSGASLQERVDLIIDKEQAR